MPHRTFNLEQVAEYLHLRIVDVRELAHHREIPCEQAGSRWVFRQSEIDAWASRRILGMKRVPLTAYHRATTIRAQGQDEPYTPVRLAELLTPEMCVPQLPARTRSSALRELAVLAGRTGLVNSPEELLVSLQEREALCSTAMPGGFAIPHPRHHAPYLLERSFVILTRTACPLPFGAPTGEKTDLFFLVCCASDRIHLHLLARICLLCHDADLLEMLRAAADAEAMYSTICHAESALPDNV